METKIEFDSGLVCAFSVRNMARTIEWFKDMLGWEVIFRIEDIGWAEIATSVRNVSIGISESETVDVKGGPTLTFGVKDVKKARAELEEKGVEFDGDIVEYPGMVRLTTFFDPDGHSFMFYENLSGEEGS